MVREKRKRTDCGGAGLISVSRDLSTSGVVSVREERVFPCADLPLCSTCVVLMLWRLLHACASITERQSNRGNQPCRTPLNRCVPFSRSAIQHTRICSCIQSDQKLLQHAHTALLAPPTKPPGGSSPRRLLLSSPRIRGLPTPQQPLTFCLTVSPPSYLSSSTARALSLQQECHFNATRSFVSPLTMIPFRKNSISVLKKINEQSTRN